MGQFDTVAGRRRVECARLSVIQCSQQEEVDWASGCGDGLASKALGPSRDDDERDAPIVEGQRVPAPSEKP